VSEYYSSLQQIVKEYKCIIIIDFTPQNFVIKLTYMENETILQSEQSFEEKPAKKKVSGFKRFMRTLLVLLLIGLLVGGYFKYFYVFGDGVKSGHLNYAVKKGNIFKTYEGKLIQEGYRTKTPGSIQSYEFEFSVKSKAIYDVLSTNSGKLFDLHYKEYHGVLPWRGNTKYIVDSIISMRD
jgi:hypothetical protein